MRELILPFDVQVIQSLPVSDACDVWSYGVVSTYFIYYTLTASNNFNNMFRCVSNYDNFCS